MFQRVALQQANGEYLFGDGILDQLEIFSISEWNRVDRFLNQHQEQHVFFILSYELGVQFMETSIRADKPRKAIPLAKFWVADEVLTSTQLPKEHSWMHELLTPPSMPAQQLQWKFCSSKEEYLSSVRKIQEHIQRGDCYELNFCQRIEANAPMEMPGIDLFRHIHSITNAPHSAYFEDEQTVLASGSPERFFMVKGNRLFSQPIKGTAPRGKTPEEDEERKRALLNSKKDHVENVMIVDLVRNDCSKIATKGNVKVDELSQLYSFDTVHQLISTVSCELKPEVRFSDTITALFPMGSMTGAPKKAAVQFSENYETNARNRYSGSIGSIAPNGDIDCNVLIRTVFYDKHEAQFSCMVGGAITHLSDPEEEWEECKTKVGKIIDRFGSCTW